MAKTILSVDDDPDIVTSVETIIEETGHNAITATNGEEGLAKVRDERPDLVIMDVLMPKQSGIKMYRELKTDEALKHIPVIIHSGIAKRTFLRSQEALTEFGDDPVPEPAAYLEKPVEPEELAAMITKLIG
jgi:two-component system phosphate regulon response regulator PhoB